MPKSLLTPELKARIDAMSREDLARAWHFAKAGDPIFQGSAGDYALARFTALGGWSPELSKRLTGRV
jgi:hypothetical protein